jgi:hypothetical protein
MAFGLNTPTVADFREIIKYDAHAGRLIRVDYNAETREKTLVDITNPPPRFAIDFGRLEVGYGHFSATGPEFRLVPEGRPLPSQPTDKDDQGRLKFRQAVRVPVIGRVLGGHREWSSGANCVLEAIEQLYNEFRQRPEAHAGQIPIIELRSTIPITMGRGARQRTIYAPNLVIAGWTDRIKDMGARSVPPPKPAPPSFDNGSEARSDGGAGPIIDDDLNDVIPF